MRPSTVVCLTVNVICLAILHPAHSQDDASAGPLGAEEIRTRLAGRSFESQTVARGPILVQFNVDGTVHAATSYGGISGRWHAEDGRVCSNMGYLINRCQALRLSSVGLQVQRSDKSWSDLTELQPPRGGMYDGDWVAVYKNNWQTVNANFNLHGLTGTWRTMLGVTAPIEGCTGRPAPIALKKETATELIFGIDYEAGLKGCGYVTIRLRKVSDNEMVGFRDRTPIEVRRR